MSTIEEKINKLEELRLDLVNQLNDKFLVSTEDEKFNSLIPKLYSIAGKGGKISVPFYSLYGYTGSDALEVTNNISMSANPLALANFFNGEIPEGEVLDFNNVIPSTTTINGLSNVLYGADIKGEVILPNCIYDTSKSYIGAFKGNIDYYAARSRVPKGKIDARNFPTVINNYVTNCFSALCVAELDLSGVDFSQAKPSNTLFGDDLAIVASSNIEYLNLNGATFKVIEDGTELFTKGSATGSVSKGGTGVTRIGTLDLSNLNLLNRYLNLNEIGTSIIDRVYIDGWHVDRDNKHVAIGGDYIKEFVLKNVTRDDPTWPCLKITGWKYSNTGGYGFGNVAISNIPRCAKLILENVEMNTTDVMTVTYVYNNVTQFTYKNVSVPYPQALPAASEYANYKDTHLFFENVSVCEGFAQTQYLYRNFYNTDYYGGNVTLKEAAREGLSLYNTTYGASNVTRVALKEDFPTAFLPDETYHVTTANGLATLSGITDVDLTGFDFDTTINISTPLAATVVNCTPFTNLGKGYVQKTNNYSSYKLNLSTLTALSYESIIGIINNLYDLNLTYDVANGGTLYTQSVTLHANVKALLTADDIAIATNKGWTIS